LRVVVIALLLQLLNLVLESRLQNLLLLNFPLDFPGIPPSHTSPHSIYPCQLVSNTFLKGHIQSWKGRHDDDLGGPYKDRLAFEFIVPSEGIVDEICEVDEDGIKGDLASDGTLFLTQSRDSNFMRVDL